jgi:hypothetical protein
MPSRSLSPFPGGSHHPAQPRTGGSTANRSMTPNASSQGNPYISPIKTGAKLDPNASAFQRKQAIL